MLPVLADGTNRTTTKDTLIGSHTIPKGTMVWIPLKAAFNSPHVWENPDQFRPVCLSQPLHNKLDV
jgi:cytochrome P450